jgi:hypothetical protein
MAYLETGRFELPKVEPLPGPDAWEPTVLIRPHHLFLSEVADALKGKKKSFANRLLFVGVHLVAQKFDKTGYASDISGVGISDVLKSRRSEEAFFDTLGRMPDEAIAQIGLGHDGMCNSCIVGKHCTATNFTGRGQRAEIEEAGKITLLHKTLSGNGYSEGEDFVFRTSAHTLYDYGGEYLNRNEKPEPIDVLFRSMLVKVGALRKVLPIQQVRM